MSNIMNKVNGKPIEDASSIANAVRYDVEQIRSDEEKALARQNIGCYCEAGGGGGSGGSSGGGVNFVLATKEDNDYSLDKTAAEIIEMAKTGIVVMQYVAETEEYTLTNFRIMVECGVHRTNGYGFSFDGFEEMFVASNLDEHPSAHIY